MVSISNLTEIVTNVLRERFDDVDIERVEIERDFDDDGDEILRIQVVFDGKEKQLDARKASSVQRYMRPKLADVSENAFPVISYVSKSDYRKRNPAAA